MATYGMILDDPVLNKNRYRFGIPVYTLVLPEAWASSDRVFATLSVIGFSRDRTGRPMLFRRKFPCLSLLD